MSQSDNESRFCTRRGLMRGAGVVAAVAALAGGVYAYAQGGSQGHAGSAGPAGPFGGPNGHGPVTPEQMEAHLDRMLKHLYVEIDATEEQKQKIAPIVKQAVRDLMPLREQLRGTREEATALFTADTIDRAAIESLRADRLKAADTASRRVSQALADVAEVLTPAQRKTLADRMQRRRRMWSRS